MSDVTFTVPPSTPVSLVDIARGYTIGGSAYAQALNNYNFDGGYNVSAPLPEGTLVYIPEEWLGFQVHPDPEQRSEPQRGTLKPSWQAALPIWIAVTVVGYALIARMPTPVRVVK